MNNTIRHLPNTVAISLLAVTPIHAEVSKQIQWSGMDWTVRQGTGEPDRNYWDPNNAWVDDKGWLHLKVNRGQNIWHAVEITSVKQYKYGKFAFDVAGPIGAPDPNVTFGVFLYPKWGDVTPGTHEIDIVEVSNWVVKPTQINYTVFNRSVPGKRKTEIKVNSNITEATFSCTWAPNLVRWESSITKPFQMTGDISDHPQYIKLNLWIIKDRQPNRETEFIIKSVKVEE